MERDQDLENELLAQEEFFRSGMRSAAIAVRKTIANDNNQSSQINKSRYNFKSNENFVEQPAELDSESLPVQLEDDFYDVYDDNNEFTGFDWSSIKQKEVENEVQAQR